MNTQFLDNYIKDLNEEYDKYNKKLIQPLAHNFISSCLSKEINRVNYLRKAVKDIKDYGCKKVGDYLYSEILLSPCIAYIQFSFSEGVPEFGEDDKDTEEYAIIEDISHGATISDIMLKYNLGYEQSKELVSDYRCKEDLKEYEELMKEN